jgi:hypothetical protein
VEGSSSADEHGCRGEGSGVRLHNHKFTTSSSSSSSINSPDKHMQVCETMQAESWWLIPADMLSNARGRGGGEEEEECGYQAPIDEDVRASSRSIQLKQECGCEGFKWVHFQRV